MSLEEVRGYLQRLDPYRLSYMEWVKLGAAIAHTYGDNAYYTFKDWSDTDGKTPLSWSKWRSLAREHGSPVTYATIVWMLFQSTHP